MSIGYFSHTTRVLQYPGDVRPLLRQRYRLHERLGRCFSPLTIDGTTSASERCRKHVSTRIDSALHENADKGQRSISARKQDESGVLHAPRAIRPNLRKGIVATSRKSTSVWKALIQQKRLKKKSSQNNIETKPLSIPRRAVATSNCHRTACQNLSFQAHGRTLAAEAVSTTQYTNTLRPYQQVLNRPTCRVRRFPFSR